ncbi:MAG TPA: single-stranded-DNA-specific exonuclease RecJ, partial [Ferruginibacter sp.]|nr:single-stranded-DNA-specific exonuclease RecJ [Ferruginibacter sp.]
MDKRWNILPYDAEASSRLQASLRIHPTLCRILTQRGITDFEAARDFFRPDLSKLPDPWLMKDMRQAVDRINQANTQNEKILVFGDYDVDGTTAVASFYSFLKNKIPIEQLDFYIPHRYREGYGISKAGIDFAHANGFTLIISLDCGIKSADLIAYASTLGIDFIVCDHHLPDPVIPKAVAILNPKQSDCAYPYKDLCGCGVGFKLMQALAQNWQLPPASALACLDLLATAIAADIVPITSENRILAYHGLNKINSNPCPGIKAIMELAGKSKNYSITQVVFQIAPRVNAAGRMDDARKAVELFIEPHYPRALELAQALHSDNTDRKEVDEQITREGLALIQQDPALLHKKTTVLYQEHWHKGVVGIVASRLIEHYFRPTIVLTKSGEVIAGSARSVPGFNLYEAIYACREHLLGF